MTELQRDANRLYNFSAKETLNYMQRLYEHHKAVTYPRTDSRLFDIGCGRDIGRAGQRMSGAGVGYSL